MLHAVMFFGALAVIETVQGTNQVTRDAADALKTNAFADHFDAVDFGNFKLLCHDDDFLSKYNGRVT